MSRIDKIQIGKNARKIRVSKGFSQTEMAEKFGVKQETISQIELGKIAPSLETINGYISIFSITYNDFINGHIATLKDSPIANSVNESEVNYGKATKQSNLKALSLKTNKEVKIYDIHATAGSIGQLDNEYQIVLEIISAPFLTDIDGILFAKGNSMEPTIKNGSRIAIKRLDNTSLINNGDIYVIIDNNNEYYIKRLFFKKESENYTLKSDNKAYPDIQRSLNDIHSIWKVKAEINLY